MAFQALGATADKLCLLFQSAMPERAAKLGQQRGVCRCQAPKCDRFLYRVRKRRVNVFAFTQLGDRIPNKRTSGNRRILG